MDGCHIREDALGVMGLGSLVVVLDKRGYITKESGLYSKASTINKATPSYHTTIFTQANSRSFTHTPTGGSREAKVPY